MKLFLFEFMITEGHSMMPTLKPGSVLLVDKVSYGLNLPILGLYIPWAAPRPGDVVVFYTPRGEIAVKRCSEITGQDEFIALGDNSVRSYDSRSYGPIPLHNIIGKVMGRSVSKL
jgi:signal peptidase I